MYLYACIRIHQDWNAGLSLLSRAFAGLPSFAHESLWEQKVTFMCKGGGRGLMGEMFRLKDFPPETQARVWAVFGANAAGQGEQLTALMRAVEALQARLTSAGLYLDSRFDITTSAPCLHPDGMSASVRVSILSL